MGIGVLLLDLLMRKGGCLTCCEEGEWDAWELVSTSASMESRRDLLRRSSSVLWEGDTGGEWRFVVAASVDYRCGGRSVATKGSG